MIPSAQAVAIDLGKTSLQVSDSTANTVTTSEPDGSFTALLQTNLPAAGQPAADAAGSALPLTGSELPVEESAVPVPDPITDFVAFYEGEDDALVTAPLSDSVLPDAADATAGQSAIADLTGMAPSTRADLGTDSSHRGDSRRDGRTNLRTLDDRGISRREHGRIPMAQPMNPPDRMIFKGTGQGAEIVLSNPSVDSPVSRAVSAEETGLALPDRRRPVPGMSGLMPVDQANRAISETLGGFELPVSKEGAESISRAAAPVQASAAASQFAEQLQVRDLAGAAKPTPVLATSIGQPVIDKAWGEAFQDRVLWMAKGGIQNAEIRLNPAELGPIRVQVSVEDDAAILNFTAQHNVTREAIEQALPRLREMLSENGLTLAGTTVTDSDEGQAEDDRGTASTDTPADAEAGVREGEDTGSAVTQRINSDSLVDTFA